MNIAIIDDQEDIQYAIEKILKKQGHTCYGFYGNEDDLVEGFEVFEIELVIIDMMLKDSLTGLDVLKKLQNNDFNIPTILITAYTTPSNLIEASMSGIVDIVKKPFSTSDILEVVEKYQKDTKTPNITLTGENEEFIGSFETMKDIYKHIGISAKSDANVFIYGETGTGKELVAKLIHKNSQRADKPFITVNCSTIPENLFEKLMFGEIVDREVSHMGYLGQSQGGTLFLDGIYNLPIKSQVKLLRFLETKYYYPLGSSNERSFDGKIISSSLKNPKMLLDDLQFKDELYYRISTLEIALPSLQKRKNDIKELVNYFIKQNNKEFNLNCNGVCDEGLQILENYYFKGNIRELKNLIYKVMITSVENQITKQSIEKIISKNCEATVGNNMHKLCQEIVLKYDSQSCHTIFSDIEKEILSILMDRVQNITKLSKILSISRNTLKDKLRKYDLLG